MDSQKKQALIEQAFNAQANAHAPYSGFQVGAAVLSDNGQIHAGCNVENAAYPLGQCAEATAIGTMVAAGGKGIKAIVIASPSDELCFPCGGCRQKIAEFAHDDVAVIMATRTGTIKQVSIGELLPYAFRNTDLTHR
ncbi:cytidine deaminase [Salinimonas lutimaris]|uniref:cytidine deaminase n=1 Tax=Salinimonas lutimaris TaxID=914153 RepID=UPI0010C10B31|nr:cytidine deaminase [Salinimonas lutimaris]